MNDDGLNVSNMWNVSCWSTTMAKVKRGVQCNGPWTMKDDTKA
jgi:hypothetical protein